MSTPFRYYKKRDRFETYMTARAAGGLLTPKEAVEAYYDFMKLWGDFTRQQKTRFAALRAKEHAARGRGDAMPAHDAQGGVQADVNFWERAFANASGRTYAKRNG